MYYILTIFAIMNTEIQVKRRGRKYNFDGMTVGEARPIGTTSTSNASNCFKSYVNKRGLNWECTCYAENGLVYVVRKK